MSNLPKGWELVETGTVTIVGAGTGFKPDFQGFTDKEIPFYKVSDMNLLGNEMFMTEANNYVDFEDLKVLKAKTFPKNTLIFPKVGAALLTNKRRILTKDSCVDNNIMTLTPIENKINPIFLYSLYLQIDFNDLSNDGALPSLNGSQVKKIIIPLPPLEEQKKIADILSTVDKKIAFVEENINATEELKKGLMQKLLTEGIDHTEFKDSELGRIPESWEIVQQSEVATFYNGRAYKLSEWEESGIPVIRLQNLTGTGTEYYYSTLQLPDHQYCINGDLLYMWSATFGPVWWKGEKAIYHYHIWKITTEKNKLDKNFLFYLLDQITIRMKKQSHGSTMIHVTKGGMEKLKIQLPPLEEQKQIAEILSTVDKKIENLKEKKQSFEELKKGLMQKLLTGEVRV